MGLAVRAGPDTDSPRSRIPLTGAIMDAICRDQTLDMPWTHFHRSNLRLSGV